MTNEERILERLESLEEKISMMHSRAETMQDLQETITPIVRDVMNNVMLKGFSDVQERCEMQDLGALSKRFLMSVRDLTWMLESMENIIELWRTCEPMIKPTFLASIEKFDELERNGVFAALGALSGSMGQITQKYTPEEFGRMGTALVNMAGLLERLADADIQNARSVSPIGMVGQLHSKESKQALGIMAELLTALGRQKS
ncbi:hypothetical protein [Desulfovibrio psychrotolerans]|uniref:DUF1641 domain-containing protein n=1 Tax=Desulfovibrio psychrotolerans TaxID=415242 RepID=A0A7J0BRI4_9BACT|nr:hypothetical protein [Desulfovibrio psychrotolerans]GFM35831.1 hypothetical protein DSM19430T_05150 [Desulfovibrio psychrotolerans]